MQDHIPSQQDLKLPPSSHRRKGPLQTFLTRLHHVSPRFKIGAAVFLIIGILVGQGYVIYQFGMKRGIAQQKKLEEERLAGRPGSNPFAQGRWTYAGKVTDASDTSVSIKTSNGQVQTFAIDSKTITQKIDGVKIDAKEVKKESNVIVSGTKKDDGKQLAQRIRIVR